MRKMLLCAVLALSATTGCSKTSDGGNAAAKDIKVPEITVDQLDKDLGAKAAVAVDCNGDQTRKHMGTIPGAVLVTDEDKFAATELPADKNTKLVFYCGGPG